MAGLLSCFCAGLLSAQQVKEHDPLFLDLDEETFLDDEAILTIDSFTVDTFPLADADLPTDKPLLFPDSIYRQRLERLPHIIPMTYNETVRRFIDFYATKREKLVQYMLGAANYYFPIIEPILEQHGLPQELKYLPIVESALNPGAVSRVGAGGLWQFMLTTGKIYGLEINSLIDERCDPVKSTEAACRYFKEMYDTYGDWHLALASFNCGRGNVHKAIRRSGGKKTFWEIYPYLPRETRAYVPLFIAANYIMNYHQAHHIRPVAPGLPLNTDTLMISQMLHFEQITDLLKVDINTLRLLNPQYRRDIVPGNIRPSALRLPLVTVYSFIDREDSIYIHRLDELLGLCIPLNVIEANKSALREKITYTTTARESLHVIGNRYGVTARDIRRWNELSSNRVPPGKKLTLFVNNGGVRFAPRTSPAPPKSAPPKNLADNKGRTYTVQAGDSLYSISQKYPGLTVASLQRANNLTHSRLYPGQKLHIPPSPKS
jgi:membrane-bound lytic murein transglycosylase D